MDGYTLLRVCKADAALCALPSFVYTAAYTEPRGERATELLQAQFDALGHKLGDNLAEAANRDLSERNGELQRRDDEWRFFEDAMVDRDLPMIELKHEVDALCASGRAAALWSERCRRRRARVTSPPVAERRTARRLAALAAGASHGCMGCDPSWV